MLVAVGVDDTGHREVVGVTEGMKEDRASWEGFICVLASLCPQLGVVTFCWTPVVLVL